jgi:hypothetical protein
MNLNSVREGELKDVFDASSLATVVSWLKFMQIGLSEPKIS